MNGITRIQLGGKERVLRFNNFANIEIAKVLFNSETAKPEITDISDEETDKPKQPNFLDALFDLNKKNHYLLLKMLIYAGIIGNDYVVGFNESVSIEEVGEWVADLKPNDSHKVWEAFMHASGLTLDPEKKNEDEQDEKEKKETSNTPKKKHPSPTKKRYKKPLVKSD